MLGELADAGINVKYWAGSSPPFALRLEAAITRAEGGIATALIPRRSAMENRLPVDLLPADPRVLSISLRQHDSILEGVKNSGSNLLCRF